MSRPLNWNEEGLIWPHRAASSFVKSGGGGATWHVQRMVRAKCPPKALLLHGTGASVHSWDGLMPLLAEHFETLAMDLPRHGFTQGHPPTAMSLPAMAAQIASLITALGFKPDVVIGHSAGAALALQLALDHGVTTPIVGLNSALRPFPGPAAEIFPAIAKLLFVNPFVPRIFSRVATMGGEAERFLYRSTNSYIPATSMACYEALLRNPRHTKGALAMMANWDLPTLKRRMVDVANPVLLVHSDNDAAIPLDWAREVCPILPDARLIELAGHGHLAHEVAPTEVAARIMTFCADHAIVDAPSAA
ncbi:MAG: alpha/beta fold hydrolase BchO [Pseudomonadota bacterium]